jgi:hypothetical protein
MDWDEWRSRYQSMAESFGELHPYSFDEVEVEIVDGLENLGEFEVETWDVEGEGEKDFGMIRLSSFAEFSREELVLLLQRQILVHELAHAAQYRSEQYELEREQDHDAEWALKYAAAYTDVVIGSMSGEAAFDYLGIDDETRERLIQLLADSMSRSDSESDADE